MHENDCLMRFGARVFQLPRSDQAPRPRALWLAPRYLLSAGRAWQLNLIIAAALIGLLLPVANVQGRADRDVRSSTTAPIAPRGGVMMLPLTRHDAGGPWPQTLTIRLEDGRQIEGQVAWIHPRAGRAGGVEGGRAAQRWTADPRGLAIRAIEPADRAASGGTPVLLVRLPETGSGPITLGRQKLEPIWRDLPAPSRDSSRPRLMQTPALDRPDPDSPFEYWRWVLLAERLEHQPPPPPGRDAIEDKLAEHFAHLWLTGLARLEAESHGLAQHVRDLLTRICHDGDVAFAAWVSDPAQTSGLLSTLLNMRRTGEALQRDVLEWTDRHEQLRLWVESDAGDAVRLALVNPGTNPLIARFEWEGSPEPPLAVEVHPGRLERVMIDRQPLDTRPRRPLEQLMAGERAPAAEVLRVTSAGQTHAIAFGNRIAGVVPPGHWLPVMRKPLSLAEVQGAPAQAPGVGVSSEYAAVAHVRRLGGRWEVFVEARRPPHNEGADGEAAALHSIDQARGKEAVILTIGEPGASKPAVVLIVPEHGWHRLVSGSNDGTLQIHRRSHEDRWVCRIVLPDAWLNLLPGDPTFLSIMRTRRGTSSIEFSPWATTPWQTQAGPAALDLSAWGDLPLVE